MHPTLAQSPGKADSFGCAPVSAADPVSQRENGGLCQEVWNRTFKEQTHPGAVPGFSVRALDAVSSALECANFAGHETVEPLHLLAGFAGTQSFHGSVLGTSVSIECGVDAAAVLQEAFRVLHHGQTPEEQSVASAAKLLASRPGADRVKRLVEKLERLHDASLDEGDFEQAVCIRGTMVQLARDEGRWVTLARGAGPLPRRPPLGRR